MAEVRAYAVKFGVKPTTVVQWAGGSGNVWARWVVGESSPTQRTLDKIRKYMAQNPPPEGAAPEEAAA